MYRPVIIVCLSVVAGCSQSSKSQNSVHEVGGSNTERVARVTAMIARHKELPTAILNAHFIEEQIGDGGFGSADFRAFYLVEVDPRVIPRWTRDLTPLPTAVEYEAPAQDRDWWIDRNDFGSLQFYQPDALTSRIHGWIGVSQKTGRIYIFTFTN